MSKQYKYIKLVNIEKYKDWDLIEIIPAKFADYYDMCVICFDDTVQEKKTQYIDIVNYKNTEIERLKSMNQSKLDIIHDLQTKLETVRIEAIKEFIAEHRKIMLAYCDDDDQISLKVCEYDASINNLVKEMVGEQ